MLAFCVEQNRNSHQRDANSAHFRDVGTANKSELVDVAQIEQHDRSFCESYRYFQSPTFEIECQRKVLVAGN
jgi:hypothetical protein